MSAQQDYEL